MPLADMSELSVPERILLVEDLWDSIAKDADAVPITRAQRAELDLRLEAHTRDPDEGETWETIRARLDSSR